MCALSLSRVFTVPSSHKLIYDMIITLVSLFACRSNVKSKLDKVAHHEQLKEIAKHLLASLDAIIGLVKGQPTILEAGSRDFALSLSNIFIAAMFLEEAARQPQNAEAQLLAARFYHSQEMAPFVRLAQLGEYSATANQTNSKLVFEC